VARGSVTFEGNGPFYLRSVERATATALANTVQLTLYATTEGEGQKLVRIETQMTFDAAAGLASTLGRALDEAASNQLVERA
jgi:hypothetical protein